MKSYRIRYTWPARDDLRLITAQIAMYSTGSADNIRKRIIEKVRELAMFPNRGKSVALLGLRYFDQRFVAEGKYYIFFRVEQDQVIVTRIQHSARDFANLQLNLASESFEDQDL